MAASQENITAATPMGASLIGGGVAFAVWAPAAHSVYLAVEPTQVYQPDPDDLLVKDPASGRWTGFFPGLGAGTRYRFFVIGEIGLKRDPWARELDPGYPDCDCVVVDPDVYPWHDQDFQHPALDDLVIYQLHIGAFYAQDAAGNDLRPARSATFLDALGYVDHLAGLGVTAVQPLPVVEFSGEWSLGYNGTDIFSPERDYTIEDDDLAPYLVRVNDLLAARGKPALSRADIIGSAAQLKVFVDICHVYGLAVIIDVVYNHAGGGLDIQSIDYFDVPAYPNKANSIYFSTSDWAGGRVFDFTKREVQDFLIGNAAVLLSEFHADGLRFDEVTVIDGNGGWSFCQRMTTELHQRFPDSILIAEYWNNEHWLATLPPPNGMGFDLGYADGLRDSVRGAVQASAAGATAPIDIEGLLNGLLVPPHLDGGWRADNCIENHDLVLDADGDHRHPRIPALADSTNSRSWYARSRARAALGLLLTAPGTPMLFMGQEILEDKLWSDDSHRTQNLVWWEGLTTDSNLADFLQFTRALIHLRRAEPSLRSDHISTYPPDETNRVAAFRRWSSDSEVVVVVSLNEITISATYQLGFPESGHWQEIFNSDYYDGYPNQHVHGNNGGIDAGGPPMHGLNQSATITVPANSILVFKRAA